MSTEVGLMSLSEELILIIFQHLPDGKSVLNLGGACNRLAAVSLDESIWRRRVKVDFPEVVKYVVASGTANSKGQPDGTAKPGTAGRVAHPRFCFRIPESIEPDPLLVFIENALSLLKVLISPVSPYFELTTLREQSKHVIFIFVTIRCYLVGTDLFHFNPVFVQNSKFTRSLKKLKI
jgi:hypothetical protein